MSAVFPRRPTPADADSATVEPSATSDMTERETVPPTWTTSGRAVLPPPFPVDAAVRSRKETLVSPIPALLAAQMGEFADELGDATPLPVEVRQDATSRFDITAQRALLATDEEEHSEYVVELVQPSIKPPRS